MAILSGRERRVKASMSARDDRGAHYRRLAGGSGKKDFVKLEYEAMTDVRQATGPPESDPVDALILDLLEWMGPDPRPYAEVLDVWRTSCPRLPVWEDANDRGFIARHHAPGRGALVLVSAAGVEHLRRHRPQAAAQRGP